MALSDFAPQGVLLSSSGCFETKVDVSNVLETIGYYEFRENQKNNAKISSDMKDNDLLIEPSK